MLTRRAKAYDSSCSQTVSLSPVILSQFILRVCAAAKDREKPTKPFILEVQGLSKSSMLIRLKSSSLVLVVIFSMPMFICNRFHERLANNRKITTFTTVPVFDALVRRLEPRKSRLGPSKSTFNAEKFIRSFFMSISIDFGAIRS